MREKTKLKIGEFSQMMQVTVKTLRHYEQKGLLYPCEVDEWTGSRYYNVEQKQRLNTIRQGNRLYFDRPTIKKWLEKKQNIECSPIWRSSKSLGLPTRGATEIDASKAG